MLSIIEKKSKYFLLLICIVIVTKGSIGSTGVITLIFPAGAVNTGLGECGVSLADNIYSAYNNPASLPAIGENNMAQFFYSSFKENLLPIFEISDLYHKATYSSIILNDIYPNFDFGYTYSNNYINMGENIWVDTFGKEDTVPEDNGVRNGQTRNDYTIGINLIYTPFLSTKQKE